MTPKNTNFRVLSQLQVFSFMHDLVNNKLPGSFDDFNLTDFSAPYTLAPSSFQTWGESTFNDSESESDSGRLFDSESESDSSQFGYDSESNSDSSNISISDSESESDSNFQLLI